MLMLINILIPIFLLILLGYFLKLIKFPHKDFWTYLDKFNYFVLFPSLLISKLSTADVSAIESFDYVFVVVLATLIISLGLMIINKIFKFRNDSFTSVYQGGTRFNSYVFLALIEALFKDDGIVIGAILMTFMIPLLNILAISIFSYYVSNTKLSITSFLKSVFSNPLIVSCLIGGGLNYFDISLPTLILNSMILLSAAALPLGLLSVGVGLHFSNVLEVKSELIVSNAVKLLAMPLLILFLASLFDISGLILFVILVFGTMPTATSSYILAKQLGGDTKLMSSIISVQTIVSIITISFYLQYIH